MNFGSEQQLAEFLGRIQPHYHTYATPLWASGVRSADELANGSVDTLVTAGITNRLHAENIKAKAGAIAPGSLYGTHLASSLVPTAAAQPKTLFVVDPPGTYSYSYIFDTTLMTEIVVDDSNDYKEFLHGAGVFGLRMVAEDQETFFNVADDKLVEEFEQGRLVRDFTALLDGGVYLYSGVTRTMLADMREELTHLTQLRQDEFKQALECVVREQDPGQDFANHPELRTSLPHPSQRPCGEVDSVILGKSKAFIGSHKAYINSTKAVLEVADHCEWLTQQSKYNPAALPEKVRGREFFAAVMGEKVKPSLREPVAKVCKERGVLQLRRNGRCISPVECHHMQRLLRM